MKITILVLLFSLPAIADTTCFNRDTEIETNEVTLGRTLCFDGIEVHNDSGANGRALIRYSVDGNRSFKTASLLNGVNRGAGTVVYQVNIESTSNGGFCDYTWAASSTATIVMMTNGYEAKVESVKGRISFSNDNCHSSMRTSQELEYTKI